MLHISFFRAVGALFAALPPQLLGTTAIQAGGAQLHAGTGRKGIAALGAVAGRETPQRHCAKVGQLHRNNSRNAAAAAGVLTDPASGALPGIHSHGEGTLSGKELQGIVGAGVGAIAAVIAAVIDGKVQCIRYKEKDSNLQGETMTEFIMVRHGEPDYSVVDEWAGIAVAKNFAPLTEKGISQIQETIEVLREE